MTILDNPVRTDDPVILYSSHMTSVYRFGHQFQTPDRCDFIVAGSFDDAYSELLEYACDHDGECDHGGEDADGCDCEMTDDGRHVWMVDTWWINEMAISVDQFLLAMGEEL